jgi:UDP:flavonoid glycosyltransferase YjiC (YdhE family)
LLLPLPQESQQHLPEGYTARHVLITPWVSQTAVLGHSAVKGFLCHGGHTTTNEALAIGKPILVMPFGGDQLVVAQHIKDHGYGLQVG